MLPKILTAKDIKEYLHIGDQKLYELLKQRDFPSFRVDGGDYKILEDDFIEWMRKRSKAKKNF